MSRHPKYEMAATKGCWLFAIWVEVEGVPVPVYNIVAASEGPEGWIPVDEEKEYTVHYTIKKQATKGEQCFLEEYPDFEVSCCADGDLMDVNLSRFNEVGRKEGAGGAFEGRQLPKKKMRRLIFSRPQLTKNKPKANIDRMGTIEVAFQRCDASHGEAFVNKEGLPNKTLNERDASSNHIDMVTSFGPVVTSIKIPTNITGTIAPPDSDDFVSMQLRYVSKHTLLELGYMQEDEPAVRSPPIQHTQPKVKKAAAPSSRARERQVATPKKVVAPAREMSEEAPPAVIAAAPQVVQEVQSVIAAIATMNKTMMDKVAKLQKAKPAEIALGYVEIWSISSAIRCMKSSFLNKLRPLEAATNSKESLARYGPATQEVQDMAEALFTMNKALQGKIKELQNGPTSANAAGLVELEAMSDTLRVMNGSMLERLESVEDQEQDFSHRRSPDSAQDDDRSARRSTAKRRKIV